MNKLKLAIFLFFFGNSFSSFSQKKENYFIKFFPVNKVVDNNNVGLWIELDSNTNYNFGCYEKNQKEGFWYEMNGDFRLVNNYFIFEKDTIYRFDYDRIKEYKSNYDIDTCMYVSADYNQAYIINGYELNKNCSFVSSGGFWYRSITYHKQVSEGCNQSSEKVSICNNNMIFLLFQNELRCVFQLNIEKKIEGKMLVFKNGILTQVLSFQDGLLDGEVIYYKNSIEVNRLIYFNGVLVFPKKITKKSIVDGFFIRGCFFPYSFWPDYYIHYLNGYFGIREDKKVKKKSWGFYEKNKKNNIY